MPSNLSTTLYLQFFLLAHPVLEKLYRVGLAASVCVVNVGSSPVLNPKAEPLAYNAPPFVAVYLVRSADVAGDIVH